MQPPFDESARGRVVGRLLIVCAAVLWSSGGFFAKAPALEGWPGPALAFWRAAWASLILLPFIRRPRWTWKLLPMVATFAGMNWSYLNAMVLGEASNAIWLQMTAPLWVFLVNAALLRERIQWRDWVLLLFGAAGVGLIVVCEVRGERPQAVWFGLLSGIFYAGVILSLRQLRDQESTWLVALNHLGASALFFPVIAGHPEYWPRGQQWLLLAGFGMLQMGLPYVLFARALKSVPSHEASGLGLLEPVLMPLWVFLAWHNAPSYTPPKWWSLVGGALILSGLLLRYATEAAQRNRGGRLPLV